MTTSKGYIVNEIVFQEPPRSDIAPRYMTANRVAALDARPGEWALLFPGVHRRVLNAVGSWVKRNPDYEVTSRGSTSGPRDVYVRRVSSCMNTVPAALADLDREADAQNAFVALLAMWFNDHNTITADRVQTLADEARAVTR